MLDNNDSNSLRKKYKRELRWIGIVFWVIILILLAYFFLTPFYSTENINTPQKDLPNPISAWLFLLASVIALSIYIITISVLKSKWSLLIKYLKDNRGACFQDWQVVLFLACLSFIYLIFKYWLIDNLHYILNNLHYVLARLSYLEEPLNLRNIFIGFFGGLSLIILAWRGYSDERRIQSDQRKMQSSEEVRSYARYSSADATVSKSLNEETYPDHLRAIMGLRDLAIDSKKYTQRCMSTICDCNQWMEDYIEKFIDSYQTEPLPLDSAASNILSTQPFTKRKLTEDNRITSDDEKGQITIWQEKRSQEALKAIRYILDTFANDDAKKEWIKDIDFSHKMLCGLDLSGIKINNINFSNTCLVASNFKATTMNNSKLQSADLRKSTLKKADLSCSDLTKAHLSEANLDYAKLDKAKLTKAILEGASLEGSYLRGAILRHADLTCTNLKRARLTLADMTDATLDGANLERAALSYSRLFWASLMGANLQKALLLGVDLRHASIEFCIMLNCNLYSSKLQQVYSKNIIFNAISSYYSRFDDKEISKWIQAHIPYIPDDTDKTQFSKKVMTDWKKMDGKKVPKGLKDLENNSLIEVKDNEWVFKKGSKTKLKKFYEDFCTQTNGSTRVTGDESRPPVRINSSERVRKKMIWSPTYYGINEDFSLEYKEVIDYIKQILGELREELKGKRNAKKS